jgi:hypothetical protein
MRIIWKRLLPPLRPVAIGLAKPAACLIAMVRVLPLAGLSDSWDNEPRAAGSKPHNVPNQLFPL